MATQKFHDPVARLRRALVVLCGGASLAFLLLPVLSVFPMSFDGSGAYLLFPKEFSLKQYIGFFQSPEWMEALFLSLRLAAFVSITATVLGVLSALGLHRLPAIWRRRIEAVLILPWIVPTIVFAVAAYSLFLSLGLIGTLLSLLIAHTLLALPFVVIFVSSALRSFDWAQSDASASLGAGSLRTFFRVIFPQIRVAVFGSGLFAFNVSFDEVIVTLFISGIRNKTLPVKVWDAITYEVTPILPAISVIVVVSTLAILLPIMLAGRKTLMSR